MEKLLIVEDDNDLQEGLAFTFRSENYEAIRADTVKKAKECLRQTDVQGIILDCNLPDGNGFELCKQLREKSDIPIMILTARDTELDEIKALELGANDYMSKPFSVAVLKTRVKKMLKNNAHSILTSGNIRVDLSNGKVTRNEEETELSSTELKLLVYFIKNTGLILSKDQILTQIWENDGAFVDDNIVSVNIRRLRIKIERDARHPQHIKTVHGMGYLWKEVLQ